jgi:ADP-ribose pyrophosphatase YjhB (NUDIX family)
MFNFCPACASREIRFEDGKRYHCPSCGFTYFQSTAAAVGCIVSCRGKILVLLRGKEPGLGKLDLPGGFVDPGEGLLEGLRRELREELNWTPAGDFRFLASFPNIYPCEGTVYKTCDAYFTVEAPEFDPGAIRLDDENSEFRLVDPAAIEPSDMAFTSTRQALAAFLQRRMKK